MRNVTSSLIAVALIAGMVGCGNGNGPVDNPPVIDGYHIIAGNTTADSVRPEQEFDLMVGVSDDYGTKAVNIEIPDAEINENLKEIGGSWYTDNTITLTEKGSYTIYITAIDTSDQPGSLEGSILCQEPEYPCGYECDSVCQEKSPGGHLSYDFFGEEPEPTFSKYEVVFNWTDTPELYEVGIYPALSQFYFENGGGGYIGPQIEVDDSGQTVEKIIFTIWSMSNDYDTTHPYLGDCSNPDDLTEGRNTQCRILDNAWIEGKPYKVTIEKIEELEDGVVWGATITDLEAEVETLIGQIKLDDQPGYKGYGLLDDFSWGFFEYYYGNTQCLEAEYGKIIRIGPVADDLWLPEQANYWHSECIRAITYSPQIGVIIEEVGEGVCRDPEAPREGILWDENYEVPLSELSEELQALFE